MNVIWLSNTGDHNDSIYPDFTTIPIFYPAYLWCIEFQMKYLQAQSAFYIAGQADRFHQGFVIIFVIHAV